MVRTVAEKGFTKWIGIDGQRLGVAVVCDFCGWRRFWATKDVG